MWSDALRAEEHAHGVHVGTVMPGFIPTEGFPQRELAEQRRTRWMLGTPEQAAEAIVEAGLGRRAERYVPRFYGGLAALRTVAPGAAPARAAEQARRRPRDVDAQVAPVPGYAPGIGWLPTIRPSGSTAARTARRRA